jgi:DNA-binding MarR family transcriptional regulator
MMSGTQQDERLIYLLFTAQHKLKMHIKDQLLKAGLKTTLGQTGILFMLVEKNDQAMSELSRLLFLDNSTVTGLIDRLEKAGLVQRKANPKDRRVSLIHITPQGIKEAKKAGQVINRINEEIKTGFSKQEINSFIKVLTGFLVNPNMRKTLQGG